MSLDCEIPVIVDRIRALIADAWIVVSLSLTEAATSPTPNTNIATILIANIFFIFLHAPPKERYAPLALRRGTSSFPVTRATHLRR